MLLFVICAPGTRKYVSIIESSRICVHGMQPNQLCCLDASPRGDRSDRVCYSLAWLDRCSWHNEKLRFIAHWYQIDRFHSACHPAIDPPSRPTLQSNVIRCLEGRRRGSRQMTSMARCLLGRLSDSLACVRQWCAVRVPIWGSPLLICQGFVSPPSPNRETR